MIPTDTLVWRSPSALPVLHVLRFVDDPILESRRAQRTCAIGRVPEVVRTGVYRICEARITAGNYAHTK